MLVLAFPQLIEVQAEYHRKSLTLLQAVLPQIKAQQGKCRLSPEWRGLAADLPSLGHSGSLEFVHFEALPHIARVP